MNEYEMYLNERFTKPNPNLHQEVGKLAKCCYLLTQDRHKLADIRYFRMGCRLSLSYQGVKNTHPYPIGSCVLLPNNVYDQTDR